MPKINKIERINYTGGLIGVLFASSKGKLEKQVQKMNDEGWNLAFIHPESVNLVRYAIRLILLILTLSLWTIGSSELLVFEKKQ